MRRPSQIPRDGDGDGDSGRFSGKPGSPPPPWLTSQQTRLGAGLWGEEVAGHSAEVKHFVPIEEKARGCGRGVTWGDPRCPGEGQP